MLETHSCVLYISISYLHAGDSTCTTNKPNEVHYPSLDWLFEESEQKVHFLLYFSEEVKELLNSPLLHGLRRLDDAPTHSCGPCNS